MSSAAVTVLSTLLEKRADPADPDAPKDPGQEEIFSSWALFIFVALLIMALFTSYYLQLKKIQAVHETVVSIFAGMCVGLVLQLCAAHYIQSLVTFNYQFFFNLVLPPIILNSGYELHQANFFKNIGTILTFAFAGTFISAVVVGLILYLWSFIHLDGLQISFVEAISVGATLSATDPVTILAIFNSYKVDPKLYTVIFGESILNDAVAIVMFEAAQSLHGVASIMGWIRGVGHFFVNFTVSLLIGVFVGIGTALVLKHTYIRRFPRLESCLILLVAYGSYLFSNGCHMSGIVSLLFCGITLKHYAYYNMSRRTQLTTKYTFQVLAQLSENFIFIYLGISLPTDTKLRFKPIFIFVTALAICVARWAAVFPLSRIINSVSKYRARRKGLPEVDELPHAYQAMLYWAGLRGAVGVALAANLTGDKAHELQATVLVVVVLTVIVFGGTTAHMLEILGIRTGVVEELDSDDEFDIENIGTGIYRRGNTALGSAGLPLDDVPGRRNDINSEAYFASQRRKEAAARRTNGSGSREQRRLYPESGETSDAESDISDLPPMPRPRRSSPSPRRGGGSPPERRNTPPGQGSSSRHLEVPGQAGSSSGVGISGAISSITNIITSSSEDHAQWFRQLDEEYIKPTLLLGGKNGHGGPHGGSGV